MLAVLRRRDFALMWFGGLISVAGDWVLYAALPFYVFQRTGSTIATAGMIAAELGPAVAVGMFAGVWVDRLDRRRLLVATNVLQALAVSVLLVVVHGGPLWVVYAVAATQSVVASFSQPAESALLPSLVAPEVLLAANALTTLNNRIARLVGVPLGGLLLGLFGLQPVVVADAISFLVAASMVSLVTAPPRELAEDTPSFAREWAEGMRAIRREPSVAALFGVLGLMTFGGTMLDPLYVAWVRDTLHQGPQLYAFLLTTASVAGIAGSLTVGRFGSRVKPRLLMGWMSVLAGALLFLKWDIPAVPVAFALTAAGGATSVMSAIGVETMLQQTVPDAIRGRVFAALGASGALFSLAGAMVGGGGARLVGVVAMLNVSAALIALSGFVVLRALR